MLKTQEPKYDVSIGLDHLKVEEGSTLEGRIFNRETGIAIPDDEPVFILRAKDRAALGTLRNYLENSRTVGASEEHLHIVQGRINDFDKFRSDHQDRVTIPD